MPSTVVHVALAGLVAAGLLGRAFGLRSLAAVVAAVIVIDLDTFLGWWISGAHRAAFHTLLFPVLLAGLVVYDTRVREQSVLRSRFEHGVHVAWVTIAAVTFAGIGPDLFFNGVNVLYPIHDQFYKINGQMLLSNQRGFVQTFVDLSPPEPDSGGGGSANVTGGTNATNGTEAPNGTTATPSDPETPTGESEALGSTEDVHYRTGVDPSKGGESEDVERVFPLVRSGQQALLVMTSVFVVGSRLLRERYSR